MRKQLVAAMLQACIVIACKPALSDSQLLNDDDSAPVVNVEADTVLASDASGAGCSNNDEPAADGSGDGSGDGAADGDEMSLTDGGGPEGTTCENFNNSEEVQHEVKVTGNGKVSGGFFGQGGVQTAYESKTTFGFTLEATFNRGASESRDAVRQRAQRKELRVGDTYRITYSEANGRSVSVAFGGRVEIPAVGATEAFFGTGEGFTRIRRAGETRRITGGSVTWAGLMRYIRDNKATIVQELQSLLPRAGFSAADALLCQRASRAVACILSSSNESPATLAATHASNEYDRCTRRCGDGAASQTAAQLRACENRCPGSAINEVLNRSGYVMVPADRS